MTGDIDMKNFKKKSILYPLFAAGLILSLGQTLAIAEEVSSTTEEDQALQQKVKARLLEIEAEAQAANREKNGYYVERKSYGTGKETDPPRYVKQANKTWLKDYESFADINWLDLGLEYRARFEHRDNDFRRKDQNIDEPILLRTRAYLGVKDILDPLRFAVELQDSRRNHGDYTRDYDTRDVNQADILQGYLELNFKETFLGQDNLGNARPIWIRAGRHAWEAGDRRLIARNEWRNTTNNFEGLRANIGDKKNDWQLELFAVKPIQRFTQRKDEVNDAQNFYGAIFNYRGWSDLVTLEPYYFLLKQDGDQVKYDNDGKSYANRSFYTSTQENEAKVDREIHTGGLRLYGQIPKTQWDFDASYVKQWGNVQRFTDNRLVKVNHDAYAYNAEVGYTFKHPWKPRLSAFYGVASGDKRTPSGADQTDNQRFDRLFGFARPWSNDDYIQMENIRTPKVRLEFDPKLSFLDNVKVDTGFSWYRLDSASDRWNAGGNLSDRTGSSGKDLGKEFDLRVRFPINQYASLNIGYAYFWGGDFVKNSVQIPANKNDPGRDANSEFFYTELTLLGF
jgi:hypothetical protein